VHLVLKHAAQDAEPHDCLSTTRPRVLAAISLLLVTPAGFAAKLYRGPGHGWFNDYAAGVLYEVFWMLVVFFLWPKRRLAARIAVWVFAVTCTLEVMQLWHPRVLERIRSTFLGAAVLGNYFDWWDFPHYAAGCALGWLLLRALSNGGRPADNSMPPSR
jgi:hypothetical protein